jgi:hypothetical protein
MSISKESFEKLKLYLVAKGFLAKARATLEKWEADIVYAYHWAAHEIDPKLPSPQVAAQQELPPPNHESGIPEKLRTAAGITVPSSENANEGSAPSPAPTPVQVSPTPAVVTASAVGNVTITSNVTVSGTTTTPSPAASEPSSTPAPESVIQKIEGEIKKVADKVEEGAEHLGSEIKKEAETVVTDIKEGIENLEEKFESKDSNEEGEHQTTPPLIDTNSSEDGEDHKSK